MRVLYNLSVVGLVAAVLLLVGATIYPPTISTITVNNINQIVTNTTFQQFIATNVWNTFNATTFISTTLKVTGKATINELIITNGFAPSFKKVQPNNQGTNFILDGSQEVYAEYDGTNNANILYITNSSTGVGVSGAAMSFKMNANNGADLTLTVNSNWVPGHTNIWKMVTTSNPGFWQTTVTNAADGNGPRWLLLSAVCADPLFNQTNTFFDAVLSP